MKFLLMGAMINIAVAWGCILRSSSAALPVPGEFSSAEEIPFWLMLETSTRVEQKLLWYPVLYDFKNSPGLNLSAAIGQWPPESVTPPAWTQIVWRRPPIIAKSDFMLYLESASGWPMVSLSSMTTIDLGRKKIVYATSWGIPLNQPQSMQDIQDFVQVRVLGFRPVWPGFAINLMLYSATLWFFWTAIAMLRRRFRLRRDLCIACGYPIGFSPVCTECGAPVNPRSQSSLSGTHPSD